MHRSRFFRDPIHGQIRYRRVNLDSSYPKTDDAVAEEEIGWLIPSLINSKAFQRLRHIRQNGLTNLVFHGMEHSRFSHSIGVSYLARDMYDRVVRNGKVDSEQEGELVAEPRRRLAVVAAGLLHDIGHGPFSHTIEDVLNDMHPEVSHWFHHETMSVRILLEDSEVNHTLAAVDSEFPRYVAAYIDKKRRTEDHWTYRLLSSQLDADRLDYLLRDARNAGLQGHGFDLHRLLDMLFAWGTDRIVVDRHATEAIEAYLIMLEHAYKAIYFHPGVRGASTLLGSVIRRAAHLHRDGLRWVFRDGPKGLPSPFRLLLESGEQIGIDQYLRLGEFHVWQMIEEWQHSDDKILADLSRRLMSRQRFRSEDYDPRVMARHQSDCESKIARLICNHLDFLSEEEALEYYVIIDDPKRVGYKTYNWGAKNKNPLQDDSIWLFRSAGETPIPIELETTSRIFDALKDINYFHRMTFPHEVREEVRALPYFSR